MITASEIVDQLKAKLQSEGNDRWTFDRDFVFAINGGVQYIVSLINAFTGAKKFSSELFREITRTSVWRTNLHARIDFSLPDNSQIWSVLSVMPLPVINPVTPVYNAQSPFDTLSYYADNVYVTSDYSAKRLNVGEWNENKFNPFYPGNVKQNPIATELMEYGYCDFSNYTGTIPNQPYVTNAIEVRPFMELKLCGVTYVVSPKEITTINDTVPFPMNTKELIIRAALRELSIKEGDVNNTIYTITAQDISSLLNAVS